MMDSPDKINEIRERYKWTKNGDRASITPTNPHAQLQELLDIWDLLAYINYLERQLEVV